MYNAETGIIYSVNQHCEKFGVRAALLRKSAQNYETISVEKLCPDLMRPRVINELSSGQGVFLNFDTEALYENQMLASSTDDGKDNNFDKLNTFDIEQREIRYY